MVHWSPSRRTVQGGGGSSCRVEERPTPVGGWRQSRFGRLWGGGGEAAATPAEGGVGRRGEAGLRLYRSFTWFLVREIGVIYRLKVAHQEFWQFISYCLTMAGQAWCDACLGGGGRGVWGSATLRLAHRTGLVWCSAGCGEGGGNRESYPISWCRGVTQVAAGA